jgi:hypothetical protein
MSMSAAAARTEPSQGRRCASCTRVDTLGRELCAACGSDLETGLPLDPPVRRGSGAPSGARRSDRRERALLVALSLVVVAAAAAAPLALLGIGPFAPNERLEPATLLRSGYPDDVVALELETVATTTTAFSSDRDFSALHLFDSNGFTAWVGLPQDGSGAGEVIQLTLARPAWISRLQIRNGDHLSPEAYERSERLQRAIVMLDGGRDFRIDLLDIGREVQIIELPQPELTTRVTIRVERTFDGTGPRGVALSEVTLVGWPADAADTALARQRAQWR